jgi:TrmH family RNA methyltransferase
LYELDAALYQRLSEFEHGVGPLVLFSVPHGGVSAFSAQQPPQRDILLLDGIQDPGNVGTLIRTAAAAGLAEVWTTPDCAWPYGSKVLRAGMGGHRQLRVITAPDDAMECLTQWGQAGVPIRAMRLDGARSLYETGLQPPGVWLLGSEGQGLSETLSALANEHLFIPMASPLESLNVAAAAAVCLFEQYRQRGLPRIGTSA